MGQKTPYRLEDRLNIIHKVFKLPMDPDLTPRESPIRIHNYGRFCTLSLTLELTKALVNNT